MSAVSSPWTGRGDLVLHIGAYKTGTTALQSSLASARHELAAIGINYPGNALNHMRAAAAFDRRRRGWANGGTVAGWRHWETLVAAIKECSPEMTSVVSAELLCELDDAKVAQLLQTFPDHRPRVLFGVRSLGDMLISSWQQYIKSGARWGLDEWLKSMLDSPYSRKTCNPSFWRRNDYATVVSRWASNVGPSSVRVVVVDPGEPLLIFRLVDEILGLEPGFLEQRASSGNRGMTSPEIEFVRHFNEQVGHDLNYQDYSRLLRGGGWEYLVEHRTPPQWEPRPRLPDWALDRVDEIARDQISRLENLGVDIRGDLARLRQGSTHRRLTVESAPPSPDDRSAATESIGLTILLGTVTAAIGAMEDLRAVAPLTPPPPPRASSSRRVRRRVGRILRRFGLRR